MESEHVDTLVRLWRHRTLLLNLYRYRKPLAFAAGLAIGCMAGCCFSCCLSSRRGNVS